MTPQQLTSLAKVCQKYGITQLTTSDVALTIALGYISPRPLTAKQRANEKELSKLSELSDEDLALYSSAPFDLSKDPSPGDPAT